MQLSWRLPNSTKGKEMHFTIHLKDDRKVSMRHLIMLQIVIELLMASQYPPTYCNIVSTEVICAY